MKEQAGMFEHTMRRMEDQLKEAQHGAEDARRRSEESAAASRRDREEVGSAPADHNALPTSRHSLGCLS